MIGEKREAIETIAHEAKRLEELAGRIDEDFLAFLLSNVQQETERILNAAAEGEDD